MQQAEEAEAEAKAEEVVPQPTEMAMAVRWAVLFPGQTLHELGLV